jgi:methylated-DNA-protein-cysteine methyltransferase related protein
VGSGDHPDVTPDPLVLRERRILDVLMALQEGEVTTYGDVADVAGHPAQARLVGHILATTEVDVPWWRVVGAGGRLVSGHLDEQRDLLRSEGVTVADGRVSDAPIGRFHRPGRAPTHRKIPDALR